MSAKKRSLGKGFSALMKDQQRDEEENTPLSLYRKALYNAYRNGPISDEEKKMLRRNRKELGITIEQHEVLKSKVVTTLKAKKERESQSGKAIKIKKKKKKKKKKSQKEEWDEEQGSIKDELKDVFTQEKFKKKKGKEQEMFDPEAVMREKEEKPAEVEEVPA